MQIGSSSVSEPILAVSLLRNRAASLRHRGTLCLASSNAASSHLGRLKKLLRHSLPEEKVDSDSKSLAEAGQQSSPRRSIAARWRELHGCGDWGSLLEPLDADLRRELLHYGDFVHAAYNGRQSGVRLPDRSYRLARHLYATAALRVPAWLSPAGNTSLIGFVAVCNNEAEIRRMGRRDIVVALRGTATWLEWAENLRVNLVEHAGMRTAAVGKKPPKVECGFRSLYTTPGEEKQSLSAAVVGEVRRLVEVYGGEELSITIAGHSLGAALAVLVADELSGGEGMPPVAVFSFGGPRVGNRAFRERLEDKGRVKVLRVVNVHDFVTRVPGFDCYEHVGRELRVDSRLSPFLKPDADPSCCHDLEAYLHLIDGLGDGAGCRFRPNAKRSLLRLLSQQRGNVKKLYVSKARALRPQRLIRPIFLI